MIKTTVILLWFALILGSNYTSDNVNADQVRAQAEIDIVKDIAFQEEVLSVINAISKEYPNGNMEKFYEDATLYFDSSNHNRNKIVLVIYNENSNMNNIKKELQEKLGDKLQFKKAKYSPKEFLAKQEEIVNFIAEMNIGSSAGYNPQTEVFDVAAPLNAEQVQALEEKFGAGNLNIEITEQGPTAL